MKKVLLIVSLIAASSLGLAASSSPVRPQPIVTVSKTVASAPLGDLSKFRAVAVDTLTLVKANKLSAATARVKALETLWDASAAKLQAKNAGAWGKLDVLMDNVLGELRINKPQVKACASALEALLKQIDALK